MNIPKDAHHTLIQAISMSLTHKDDAMTTLLGKLLRQVEEPEVRRVDTVHDYKPLSYVEFTHTPYTHLVYRVTDVIASGETSTYLTTVKRYAKECGIPEQTALKEMFNGHDLVEPVAELNEEISDKYVTVFSKNTMKDYGNIVDIALKYKLHVEDIQTAVEENLILDDTFKFKFVGVDKI